jgi:hypothetical protein
MRTQLFFPAVLTAVLAIGGTAHAAGITLHSHKGDCHMTVPADWQVGKLLKSSASSPDGSMHALISTSAPDTGLAFSKQIVESTYPPKQVFEDSSKRLFYRYGSGNGNKPGYYVGVPGPNGAVCGAQIGAPAGKEALVKQIAATVGPTP